MGEETLAGNTVWHARSNAAGNTDDIWVRESDGQIVQLAFSGASGNFTMTFDSYNKSPVISVSKRRTNSPLSQGGKAGGEREGFGTSVIHVWTEPGDFIIGERGCILPREGQTRAEPAMNVGTKFCV